MLYQNAVTYNSCDSVMLIETHESDKGNGADKRDHVLKKGLYGKDYVDTINGLVHIDVHLMIIDVEGFESADLNGAKNLTCWNTVLYITIEFSHETRQSKDCSALQMLYLPVSLSHEISDGVADAPNYLLRSLINSLP